MSSTVPNAGWKLSSLLRSLSAYGWGELASPEYRHCRVLLGVFAQVLPSGAAEGAATAPQLARYASYSERHVRRALHVLEDLGIVQWTRGGIREGKPLPSYFRIVKRRLVELISRARPVARARERLRRQATRARCAQVGDAFKPRGTQTRGKRHADMVASLSYLKIEDAPDRGASFTRSELHAASVAAKAAVRNAEAHERVEKVKDDTGLEGAALMWEMLARNGIRKPTGRRRR
ncbi:MAG: hypothetical protein PUK40_05420 [Actinomycetaceae bacterium]|nr:hypothetical protein [Arcanobacterium sp.]MDD7505369.1 hypothetical protein [Actinomycetaceae bacterium]MDY6142746.1 hypothetical protein [Arcanobacterium sp.]